MKLTIGMIVKNEEKYLDRCLSAIKPILDNVDSELIITDTGSTDRTVEIAGKYTEKILHFDWINDFSAARNTGIEKAQGEWFMMLDADDIFLSCGDIIRFFNSGEYRSYNSATYISRNLSADGIGSDLPAPRMTKLLPETRYTEVIHEHINTYGSPIKHLSDIAEHYGYIYKNDDDRIKKFERNYKLLLKKFEYAKDSSPMIYAEMYDTLAVGFRQKEADEYLEKGINWCIDHEHPILILLYCKKARHLLFEKQTEEALTVCENYFGMSGRIRSGNVYSDVEILAVKATALYRLGRYEESVGALTDYFRLYDELKAGKLDTKDKMYGSLSLASDSNYLSYVGQLLVCCLNLGKYEFAAETVSKLPIYKYSDNRDMLNSVISLEASVLEKVNDNYFDKFCKQLDRYGKDELKKLCKNNESEKNGGKLLLTIGMIVKNEEKWLDRCLSAIKPILDNVDSELIITDTGSTDSTVDTARKYTDKVLHFDWINDFAAARNFGLEKARGEWFMMLDADDIFRSCDNIIKFFNSGEYKKFNAATYISRNWVKTDNGDTYNDTLAPRMAKIKPDTRYEFAVHESLTTFDPPYKNIQDIADHYGYYYENEEEKVKKFRRNSELLLKRLETEKETTPMLYLQIYEAYRGVEENEKALEYLNAGIELSKKLNSIVLAALYFHKAGFYQAEKQYENAVSVCGEYFAMSKAVRPYPLTTDGEICGIKSMCLYELQRYSEAADTFIKFFDIYRDIESGKIATYDSYLISAYMCSEINIMPLFCNFIDSCIKAGRLNTADSYLSTYPIGKYSFEAQKVYELVHLELTVSEHFSYKNTSAYYKKLNDSGKKILADELFDRLDNTADRTDIFAALNKIAGTDNRLAEKTEIYKEQYNQRDPEAMIFDYIRKYGIAEDIDLIGIILKNNYDLSPAFSAKIPDLRQCAYLCCKNIKGFYEYAGNYDAAVISDVGVLNDTVKFYDYCIGMRLVENEDKPEEEKKRLIEKLLYVKNELNGRCRKTNATIEFQQLAAAIKRNILALIEAGDIEAARKTLEEYRMLNPNDVDIAMMEENVNGALFK